MMKYICAVIVACLSVYGVFTIIGVVTMFDFKYSDMSNWPEVGRFMYVLFSLFVSGTMCFYVSTED